MKELKVPAKGISKEWIAVAIVFVAVSLVTAYTQKPLTYHNGEGWDGTDYCAVVRCFAAGQRPAAAKPFVYRIGGPLLVALIDPRNPVAGFRILNIIASAITVFLFVLWLRAHVNDWRVRVLLVLLYAIGFMAPVRFLHYYPANVDPLTHLGVITGMLLLHWLEGKPPRVAGLCMAGFAVLAVTVRELMLVFPIALIFHRNPVAASLRFPTFVQLKRLPSAWLLAPAAAGGAVYFFVRHWVITIPAPYFELIGYLYDKSLVPYFHAWFIAYGPVLALLIWKGKDAAVYLCQRQSLLAAFLGIAALAWFGGGDTEKFHLWTFPITFALLGRVIESNLPVLRSRLLLTALAVTQAISQRVFWPIPDYPPPALGRTWVILTMWGTRIDFMNLQSYYGRIYIQFLSFLEYVLLIGALVVWLRYLELKQAGARGCAHTL